MPMSPRLLRPRASGVHPEAAGWRTRVVANGGSVSATTMQAVDRFCRSIDAAGIRDRFFRLNLFCGNSDSNLAAVRTPLYRGPSLTGTQFGNATDTNFNFGPGDYAETGASCGLQGNGIAKRLDTGLNASVLPSAADVHLSAWKSAGTVPGGRAFVAVRDTASTNLFRVFKQPNTGGSLDTILGQVVVLASPSGAVNDNAGMVIGSRTSATSLALFWNGSSVATNATSTAGTLPDRPFFVFADNQSTGAAELWPHRISAYSIGRGLTSTQAASFYAALNTFMAALSRT